MIRLPASLRATIQRTTLPVLVSLSAAVIILGKADQVMLESVRTAMADRLAPALAIVSRPLAVVGNGVDQVRAWVSLYQENQRLEQDNARLLQWQQTALKLAADNQQLRGLLHAVREPALSFVSARVIANSGGAYVRTVMVNAGAEDGLARGQAALAGEGLVGRLTEVGARAARVLLITDLNSRIPVVIDGSHVNAVLAGDNSQRPRLIYAAGPDPIEIGQRVVTSGEGGVFPPGLPVGVVAALEPSGPRVEPFAELGELGYVLVANYGLADDLPQPVPPAPRTGRRGKPNATDEPVH